MSYGQSFIEFREDFCIKFVIIILWSILMTHSRWCICSY